MGASHALAAHGLWAHIPDPAFRLLVFMCLKARDTDDPPVFWGGAETLAIGMGRRAPLTAADTRAAGRAMRQLREAGAITRLQHSSPGSTARHRINLTLPTHDARRPVNDADTGRPTTGEHRTPGGTNTGRPTTEHRTPGDRTQDAPRPAEEVLGVLGEAEEKISHCGPSSHPPARETPASKSHAQLAIVEDAEVEVVDAELVSEAPTAQVLVGEWIERCDGRPPGRVIGQVAKLVKEMLEEGIDADVVRRSVVSWQSKGLHPSTLPSEVNAVANARPAARNGDIDWDLALRRARAHDNAPLPMSPNGAAHRALVEMLERKEASGA